MNLSSSSFLASCEPERLAALHSYEILDTESDPVFNDLALLAAFVCGTPMSLVSLLDEDRQWSKAMVGLDTRTLPREQTFCDTAVRTSGANGVFEAPDTANDARFANRVAII